MITDSSSLPSRIAVIIIRIWVADDQSNVARARKPCISLPALTRLFTWSTVQSSTMALTCAMSDPMSVRISVTTTCHLYGLTNGQIFLKRRMRFIINKI